GAPHRGSVLLGRIVRVRDGSGRVLRFPLMCAGGTLGQLPFVLKKIIEIISAPLRGRLAPGYFGTAGDRVPGEALAVLAFPTETLILDQRAFRLRAQERRVA